MIRDRPPGGLGTGRLGLQLESALHATRRAAFDLESPITGWLTLKEKVVDNDTKSASAHVVRDHFCAYEAATGEDRVIRTRLSAQVRI